MEVHRKIFICVGVVPVVPCAICRQTQKIEGKQLIVSYFKFRSVWGEILGLILQRLTEKQGWFAWLWWEYSKFLLSSLQGKLGLLQGEEALDRILKPAQGAAPKRALVQSTCGWMLLETVSGNCCCIYSTVKKTAQKSIYKRCSWLESQISRSQEQRGFHVLKFWSEELKKSLGRVQRKQTN